MGEKDGVTEVEYAAARVDEGPWADDALDAFLREQDGDAVALPPAVIAELERHVGGADIP